jgi:diadenosine tetraphosphatase ApaH/serine/threonine PP2A family protein phosphatase
LPATTSGNCWPARDAPAARQTSSRSSTPRSAQRDWLAALPATLEPTPGVFVCHGQPGDDREYLLETVDPAGSRPATGAEVLQRLDGTAGAGASLLLCGHSHLPRVAQVGGTLCVNPGSVGLPAYDDDHIAFHVHQTGSPHARYAAVRARGHRRGRRLDRGADRRGLRLARRQRAGRAQRRARLGALAGDRARLNFFKSTPTHRGIP